ncbi:hypothetical protein Q4519_14735 [Motilimonas sp. 1_MG-2023]|uniref:hypothetical protein n=1 Tax=Motilimonas sp. 1_MG-2023 TaxID=3062672 RepID=UPI0026E44DCD|nr:hypothetical protein [Motilimonas sp. 1_MG-2023]MDO6526940.1 hypothetical protein [Motilimonas sp. 1_MG-2023]
MISFADFSLAEFVWQNRFEWDAWVSHSEYAIDGSLLLEQSQKQAGQPIVLVSEQESFATYMALKAHASSSPTGFSLTINDEVFNVVWLHQPQAITATPAIAYADLSPSTMFDVTLNFITI